MWIRWIRIRIRIRNTDFIFLVSVIGVIIFSILDSTVYLSLLEKKQALVNLHLVEMDTDPDSDPQNWI
jgi:hypothetical protein